jgi:hypothetical protein
VCPLRSPVRSLASTHQPVESLPLHALLLVVALVVAIAAQGAYYGAGQRTVAVVLLLALLAGLPAANTLQPTGSSRHTTTANAEAESTIAASLLVKHRPYLRSHGRGHRAPVRLISTISRPALRAAACGGRPRPATSITDHSGWA